ncbi:hypothetical protein LXA43DRAFT_992523 [Ganoderma leucocontextum]|nr:hypothetical protein LXA43DRAFT_992523 [Ganoderma leucocontextum]
MVVLIYCGQDHGLEVENWDQAASASSHARRLILSASALLIYDMILTMDCEVKTMWQRRLRVVDFVYFTNRYGQLWNVLLSIVLFAHYDDDQRCHALSILAQIATMVPNISWAAFSGLRTYALSNGNLLFGWIVFGMSSTFIIPSIYSLEGLQGVSLPSPLNCVSSNSTARATMIIASRTIFLVSEIIVMTLTWRNTIMDQRLIRRLPPRAHSLQRVLLVNGIMCFAVSFILNGLMFTMELASGSKGSRMAECLRQIVNIVGPFRNSISTILLSRFLLELEKLRHNCDAMLDSAGVMVTTQVTYHPSDVPSAIATPLDYA